MLGAAVAVAVALGLVVVACTGSDTDSTAAVEVTTEVQPTDSRSSGQVDGEDSDAPAGSGSAPDASPGSGSDTTPDGGGPRADGPADGGTTGGDGPGEDRIDPPATGTSFVPDERPDGIQFVFVDGLLGPVELGSTIDEIAAALGPDYEITPEGQIRVGFASGYSIARDGEVLFWAIEEEDGTIGVLMSRNPKIGLESGLRPKLSLDAAIALHGEPTITFGPEGREFVSFADGIAADGAVSALVAIGEFGGPVGVYEADGPELGEETTGYQPDDANISELWFWAA